MITEEQKKKYEEVAKEYALRNAGVNSEYISEKSFKAGAEHAHSEGFNQGWNEALDAVIDALKEADSNQLSNFMYAEDVLNSIQKLRK